MIMLWMRGDIRLDMLSGVWLKFIWSLDVEVST